MMRCASSSLLFFFNDTATTEIYTLSLHDALPISMINTGTVIGVGTNIFGSDFPRNFVPSFSWGGASGFTEHKMNQFVSTAEAVMKRRNKTFDDVDRRIIEHVFADPER